jgi:PAS domain S-box-containing protein
VVNANPDSARLTRFPAPADFAALARWRERILRATGLAAEIILQDSPAAPPFPRALGLLGEATGVSRVYVFDHYRGASGARLCSHRFEWCAPGVAPQIDNPDLQGIDMDAQGYTRWLDELAANRSVYGRVADFPPVEQPLLTAQGILSAAVVPIFARGRLWGFLGFDDCEQAHHWTEDLIGCLWVAARVLGAATERAQLKREQQQLLQHYEELLENLNDVVFRARRDGSWSFLSRSWERLTGWPVAEALGRNWREFVEPEDLPRLDQTAQQLASGELREARREVRLVRADGRRSWVIVNVRWIEGDGERGPDFAGTLNDIDEAKKTELDLQQARLAAEAANRAKSEFLSTMSHELRTPLNAVIGLSDSLLETGRTVDPVRTQRYLQVIHQSGRQLLALINDLLDLARIESGRLIPEPTLLRMDRLCRGVAEGATADAAARDVELRLDLPDQPLLGWGDERLLRQALQSLVGNAIKFTSAGGRVCVQARSSPSGGVILSVQDNGIGIAPEKLHLLFRPFSQVDSSLSRNFRGSGLGLNLVDRIIRLHGGEVRVESEPGRGSVFQLDLPPAPAAPSPA